MVEMAKMGRPRKFGSVSLVSKVADAYLDDYFTIVEKIVEGKIYKKYKVRDIGKEAEAPELAEFLTMLGAHPQAVFDWKKYSQTESYNESAKAYWNGLYEIAMNVKKQCELWRMKHGSTFDIFMLKSNGTLSEYREANKMEHHVYDQSQVKTIQELGKFLIEGESDDEGS